ncbi:AAA family ATPase [Pararhodospirillum oryzae]|uniref:AAA family ATPase n=1 Tax=Pararhodospirillum oryzae TaxID=478448 RepID=UPI001478FF28|nr:ATP-binding protein [Pararhodospirillum oryzae]
MPRLVPAAAVFGPNGAGKTTLVKALGAMRRLVVDSARESQEGDPLDLAPFRLSAATRAAPSEFEIIFREDDIRFQYGFVADDTRVHEEWLFARPPGGRTQRWFERRGPREEWYVNPSLKGEKEAWKQSTRDNALFLSSAVQLNATPLRVPFNWFHSRLQVIRSSERLGESFSVRQCEDPDMKRRILHLMQAAGVDVSDIRITEHPFPVDQVKIKELPQDISVVLSKALSDATWARTAFGHRADDDRLVYLDLDTEESDGTRVLFALAGPWLDVLDNGLVVVVDELSNSLHPLAFRRLIDFFHDKETNPHGAQLVLTTHDTSVLDRDFLHSDQIWMVERTRDLATTVTPLSDYKVRAHESLQRGYLAGRYGAVPMDEREGA